ncbi:zf-HC2 domain-containing protein [Streptomyces sp. NBC_01217]|uniref:zf-HC2 domain-containing protein n=1 Tax=Streptomyces sp. NBC_01217 TaxID=2903779 RepID=UPI002E0E3798|nr:zf-HC2 domain-containing protein [Streptomyces sp. NBC_01217]
MRTLEPHRYVGAHALGVLGAADSFRFEEHLADCARCRDMAAEFAGVAAVLGRYARLTPPGVGPVERAGPELLGRVVGVAVARRRRSRGRRIVLVAAAVVLAVTGALTVPGGAGAQRWEGADRASGAAAVVTTGARDWGTEVGLDVARVPVAGVCALVAVGRDGSEETVATWSVHGPGPEHVVVRGGAALRPESIDHFEVRTAGGRRLLRITR